MTALVSGACAAQITPQETAPISPPSQPYVLHAYTDLLQIPTLVLDRYGSPAGRLESQSFQLRIDSGPPFHPAAVHGEGGDPLSLAVVLDASGAESELIKALPDTPGHGLPVTLLPEDVLSVYAFDCKTFHSGLNVPASNAALPELVPRVLAIPQLHKPGGRACSESKRLWDTVAIAAYDLARQPGRRAILLITDGQDYNSTTKWEDLRRYAASHSIAVFGLFDPTKPRVDSLMPLSHRFVSAAAPEDLFAELAGRTGGLVLPTEKSELAAQLEHVITLLRSRYILQFSRPEMATGEHHLDVYVTNHDFTVHAAGITVPARDPRLWNDPTTVPIDKSRLPVAGKRKPLKP